MTVHLSVAFVTGAILVWLVKTHAKPFWIAAFGIIFAVNAPGLVGGLGKQSGRVVTRGVGQGINMADEMVNGGGPGDAGPGGPEVDAKPTR